MRPDYISMKDQVYKFIDFLDRLHADFALKKEKAGLDLNG